MLVELGLVEQRLKAVHEVLDGATVTDVAMRNGVTRQTVHSWLRRYANSGVAGLVDKTSKPESCPHQMTPAVEARIVEMRRTHPRWGPRTIRTHLDREGVTPLPGRSSIYRALVRHRLLEPTPRKRARSDYKRWERSKSMELWQMDIVGRFHLADGTEVKVVTGVDDHSRYCVCARIVARATAKPVCDALEFALKQHGAPNEILTDNGKVFTARFGLGPGPVLFDRICHNNGIKHRLTAPYSPTTTGKVERFHRTYRDEFLVDHDRRHATIAEAQQACECLGDRDSGPRTTFPNDELGMTHGRHERNWRGWFRRASGCFPILTRDYARANSVRTVSPAKVILDAIRARSLTGKKVVLRQANWTSWFRDSHSTRSRRPSVQQHSDGFALTMPSSPVTVLLKSPSLLAPTAPSACPGISNA